MATLIVVFEPVKCSNKVVRALEHYESSEVFRIYKILQKLHKTFSVLLSKCSYILFEF